MIQKIGPTDEMPNGYHRPSDKWVETPVSTVIEDGEFKTVTARKRSLRSKRNIFTLACTAFTVGALIILLNSPYKNEFIVPGGLSANHAQVLAGQGADRCAACHADADGSLTSWISGTISDGHKAGLAQAELCMKCHDKTLSSQFATNPHNVSPESLAEMTSKVTNVSFDAGMGFKPPVHGGEIACSACHREHHGANHDLAAMTDSQCQSCHKQNFHSFGTDHPEFVNYPLKQRSAIAFDHTTHFGKHFPASNSEFNCNQCHIDDEFQNVKKLASFEQSCASCHDEKIQESAKQGLAFISLPMIDTNAIEDNRLKVGAWPLAGTGDFDGVIPPVMRSLLMADAQASEILTRYGDGFEFGDIDPDEPEQVKDAVALVWAIKRLLYDLALNGKSAVRTRLESSSGISIPEGELRSMLAGLNEVVFQNAVRRWLPNLSVEISLMGMTASEMKNIDGETRKRIALKKQNAFWWPSDESLYLNLAVDDELAANPLKGLIKPLGKIGDETYSDDDFMPLKELESDVGTEPESVTAVAEPNSMERAGVEQSELAIKKDLAQPSDDSELLAINPLQQIEKTGRVDPLPTALELAGQPDNSPPAEPSKPARPDVPSIVPLEKDFAAIEPDNSVAGWFRNDATFKITYRPSGHSDDCLESWIDFAARSASNENSDMFEKLMSPTGIGNCRTCHTVDQMNESLSVNWQPNYRDPSIRGFTRFSHGPHMLKRELRDCSHCHSMDTAAGNTDSFVGLDPMNIQSNFHPMTKSNCTTCHGVENSSSGCTQCHNYHVGSHVTGTK